MKRQISIIAASVLLLASGCQQEQIPTPAQQPPPTTQATTEDSLVGHWTLCRTEVYYSDTIVPQQTQTYNNPGTCYLSLDSLYAPNTNNTLHQCVMAHIQCVAVNSTWKMVDTRLDVGGTVYDILCLGADTLVFQQYNLTNPSSETRYYLNR